MNIEILSVSCSFNDLLQDTLEDFINGVQIRTCSCYFNHYILWLNSAAVKKIVSRHSLMEIYNLVDNYCTKSQKKKCKIPTLYFLNTQLFFIVVKNA